jgi:hypothetical protein
LEASILLKLFIPYKWSQTEPAKQGRIEQHFLLVLSSQEAQVFIAVGESKVL